MIAHLLFWNLAPKDHRFVFPMTRRTVKLNVSCDLWLGILIGRADQKVAVNLLHVDGTVWRVLHGIDVDERASRLCHLGQFLNRVDRAEQVGCVAKSSDLGLALQGSFKIIEI